MRVGNSKGVIAEGMEEARMRYIDVEPQTMER